jgi:carbon-monoxide dehydrogenase large subunit
VARSEDLRLLTGAGCYLGDSLPPETLHAAFMRSPVAHGRILRVRPHMPALLFGTADDLVAEGIRAIAADRVAGFAQLDDPRWTETFQYPLARGRVRHVGEAVAIVVAGTEAAAREAADAVDVDYATDPALADLPSAYATPPGVPLHDAWPDGIVPIVSRGDEAATAAAFASASDVVSLEVPIPRVAGAAIEPRSALAAMAEDGSLVLDTGTQRPWQVRDTLAATLGIAPDRLRLRFGDVGGGFGIKNQAYPEHVALLWAARRLGRPVLWRATRSEDMASDAAGRDTLFRVRVALGHAGLPVALDVERLVAFGAYAGPRAVAPAINGLGLLAGPYRFAAAHVRVTGVFTSAAPTTVYRGAGRPETVTACEVAMDAVARHIGEDPVRLRRRMLLPRGARNALGVDLGDADPERLLAAAAPRAHVPPAAGRVRGVGISLYVEDLHGAAASAPARITRHPGAAAGGPMFELTAGTASNGQGHETSLVRVAARVLGVAPAAIAFRQGDTSLLAEGAGTGGSWSLTIGGNSVLLAAEEAVTRGAGIAAELLEVSVADVEHAAGCFTVAGTDRFVAWSDVLAADPGFAVEQRWRGDAETRPCGCHVMEVSLDLETAEIALERATLVQDSGELVDHAIAAGQLAGGAVQGIGAALLERMAYDGDAQLLSGSFMDYAVPRASDVPDIGIVLDGRPAAGNPLGVKGIGEAGTTGAAAAVLNAVNAALAQVGAPPVPMPATPEAIWRALRARG